MVRAMLTKIGGNDIVLVLSLLYLSVDIQFEWEAFRGCWQPIHVWLLVSYGLIVTSRLIYIMGTLVSEAESGDFLLNLRQKDRALKMLMSLTWLVLLPFFAFWTALGTVWLRDVRRYTPQCLPNGVHLWFLVVWQILSYLWVLIHCVLGVVAWFLERRLRKTEGDLRQIESEDMTARWGPGISRLQGYTSLHGAEGGGLSPSDINSLPSAIAPEAALGAVEEECPVCLCVIEPGDSVRQLTACGHTFHRSCIDLWLVRRADCPLCKRKVKAGDGQGWEV